MPSLLFLLPLSKPISLNDGHRSTSLSQLHRQPLLFGSIISLDKHYQPPYISTTESNILSKKIKRWE